MIAWAASFWVAVRAPTGSWNGCAMPRRCRGLSVSRWAEPRSGMHLSRCAMGACRMSRRRRRSPTDTGSGSVCSCRRRTVDSTCRPWVRRGKSRCQQQEAILTLSGNWLVHELGLRSIDELRAVTDAIGPCPRVRFSTGDLGRWDSALVAFIWSLQELHPSWRARARAGPFGPAGSVATAACADPRRTRATNRRPRRGAWRYPRADRRVGAARMERAHRHDRAARRNRAEHLAVAARAVRNAVRAT